jgi:hypothetical protein
VIQKLKKLRLSDLGSDWLFLSSLLVIHSVLTVSYVTLFNNYFLPILFLVATLASKIVRSQAIAWPIALSVLIASTILSVAVIEPQKSYVEANWERADHETASGMQPRQVFAWPSWYGWYNYGDVIGDLEREISMGRGLLAFDVFGRMRDRACYVVMGRESYSDLGAILVESVSYRTLFGSGQVFVFSRCK